MNNLQKEILIAQIINRAKEKPKLRDEDYLDLTIQKTKSGRFKK